MPHPGFYTEGGKLYDAKGNEFIIRGVNNPHAWFDPDNQYLAHGALDTIASYKTNTIRVVWTVDLLVNVANEWSGDLSAYGSAIGSLRSGGIQHTLVVDASGYGQDINSIISNAPSLQSGDSGEGKLLFGIHMYSQFGGASAVTDALQRAQNASIPLVVGEFGPQLSGANVA